MLLCQVPLYPISLVPLFYLPAGEVRSDAREETEVVEVFRRRDGRQGRPLLLRAEQREDLLPAPWRLETLQPCVQGGPSGCTLRFADIKLRVAFWYKEATSAEMIVQRGVNLSELS